MMLQKRNRKEKRPKLRSFSKCPLKTKQSEEENEPETHSKFRIQGDKLKESEQT